MDECCIYLQDNLFNDHYVPHSFFFIFFSLYLLLLFLLFSFIFPVSATYSSHAWYHVSFFYLSTALQRQNTEISKQIFPEKEYWDLSPNFHIHVSVIDLCIYSHYRSAYSAGENM